MAFPGSSEANLLLALHAAAAGEADWSACLRLLGAMTGAAQVLLHVRTGPAGKDSGRLLRQDGGDGEQPALAAWCAALRPERVHDERDPIAWPQTALPAGFGAGAMRAIRADAGAWGSLTLLLGDARSFDAADGALLRRLFPSLQLAAAMAGRAALAQARRDLAARVAGRGGAGWLLLDASGLIVDRAVDEADLGAGARLSATPQGERLTLEARADEQRLAGWLADCAGEAAAEHALWIDPAQQVALRLTRHRGTWSGSPRLPVALATIHRPQPAGEGEGGVLGDLFGLLPSEARLALALVRGQSLSEAAATLGITIETARNYSKKLFAKTGTRGQADLVRRLLGMRLTGS